MDTKYIEKIENILEIRRKENPLKVEADRIWNNIVPSKELNELFVLGRISMLADIKKHAYQYMCKDCKEIIDLFIKQYQTDNEYKEMANKLF
jgi:hypothetical protein